MEQAVPEARTPLECREKVIRILVRRFKKYFLSVLSIIQKVICVSSTTFM